MLNDKIKTTLLELARASIVEYLKTDKQINAEKFLSTKLGQENIKQISHESGVFVTLYKKDGALRGCVGRILPKGILYNNIAEYALHAAFNDNRFKPVSANEVDNLIIEISVLTPPKKVESYSNIELGKHGVILSLNQASSVFLPQVATEWNWGISELMEHLSEKAGLNKNAYKDPNAQIEVFEAEVFNEHDSRNINNKPNSKMLVKKSDFAGGFYPDDPKKLIEMLNNFVEKAEEKNISTKAIIVPHAGYIYSGEIAGTAYKALKNKKSVVKDVVIISPSHNYLFSGIAYPLANAFETPLGQIGVNNENIGKISQLPQTKQIDEAFHQEHSVEVQIPFIQYIFGNDNIKITPLIVGKSDPSEVQEVIEKLWDGASTAFVITTDLSHYKSLKEQQRIDGETIRKIERLEFENLDNDELCGYYPVRGFLKFAKKHDYRIVNIDKGDSSKASHSITKVVGYGAFALQK